MRDDGGVDARDWDRRWLERAAHGRGEPSSVVTDALSGMPPGRALDLGCGSGRHAVWLAGQGWRVTAVDFAAEALRQARERAAAAGVAVDWVEADATAYELEAGAYDLVLLAYIHLPAAERRRLLARAAGAVGTGGALLVVGHHTDNLAAGAPGPSSPAVLYSAEDVAADLAGLTAERAERVLRPARLDDGTEVEAVDALVLARR